MITILSRDTAWSHRYIVYEKDGKRDVFVFPLAETFASAEARLYALLTADNKAMNNTDSSVPPTSKTRRTKSSIHTTDEAQNNNEVTASRQDGGVV
ncbi:MAG: hypothetical protein Q4G59_04535 [Planctomycetia bacterium]|nr:hypothetical protein [Planctomycetia bacterium]